MGEYFKEEKAKETTTQERALIIDSNVLYSTYDILVNKIKETTTQGYEAILPIRNELSGTGATPDDMGQIGELRRRIQSSRIYRMDMGIMMWNALKNIDDLNRWSERYSQFLEDYLDELQFISRSAFAIINNLQNKIRELNLEIRKLNDKLIAQTEIMPIPMVQKEIETETKRFNAMLEGGLKKYENAKREGNAKATKISMAKIFEICESDIVKWEIAQKEMQIIDKKMQKEITKKNEPKVDV